MLTTIINCSDSTWKLIYFSLNFTPSIDQCDFRAYFGLSKSRSKCTICANKTDIHGVMRIVTGYKACEEKKRRRYLQGNQGSYSNLSMHIEKLYSANSKWLSK